MPTFKVTAPEGWGEYKFGDVITDPYTYEANLIGQVEMGVLTEVSETKSKKVEE